MLSRTSIFLPLFACLLLAPAILAAPAGPANLIEIQLDSLGAQALLALEGVDSEHLRLAARAPGAAFLHASSEDLETLSRLGIEFDLVARESHDVEYYIVDKRPGAEEALERAEAEVLADRASFYLIAVSPQTSYGIYRLPGKRRLSPVSGPAVPLRLGSGIMPEVPLPEVAFTYSPAVQSMVDQVSETRLYDSMMELSGETSVVVGGETYTIHTRYSDTALCKIAGFYLKESFEALGLEAEIHYFHFMGTLKAVYFPTGNAEGWVAGRSGRILHTEDGGATWWPQDSGVETALNDVFMLDNYVGCVAGNGGIILYTGDGGGSWHEATTPTGADLEKVHLTDANTGYCCGEGGVMLKSTDGGASWFSLPSGTGNDLNSVVFVNSDDGWAVGDGGKIIRTDDGGASWSNVSSPGSDNLLDVTFVGETDGWIATAGGSVLKTEDGSVWQEVSTPVTTPLRGISFAPNGVVGYATGPDGGLVKTSDGGDTWDDYSIYSLPVLWDVHFVSSNEGWLCGSGYLLHTVDGAGEWDDQRINVQAGDMNIIATKPGTTSPDEIYIVCGHYDSISNNPVYDAPGADDNGTGTLCVLEAARALLDYDYEATLRFVCFSREEQGLVGSGAYAGMIAARGDDVQGVLNFDMIGYVDQQPEEVEIIHDGVSEPVAAAFGQAADLYVPTLDYRLRSSPGSRSSDHAPFWDQGYMAFCGIEDAPPQNPHYHRTTDRIYTLDFDFFGDVVRAAVGTLAELARIDTTSAGVRGRVPEHYVKILPNPCIGGARLEFAGKVSPGMELEFYDVQGRLIDTLRPAVEGNRATAAWDARDVNGEALSPGIYFVKTAGARESHKIVLLK